MTIILEGGYFFIRDDSEPCTWMYHARQMIFVINSGRHSNCQGKIWASQCICIKLLIWATCSLNEILYIMLSFCSKTLDDHIYS